MFTARLAAMRLGVDIEDIVKLAEQMEPEDGCLSILDSLDKNLASVTGFTSKALEDLEDLRYRRWSRFMSKI